MRLVLMHTSCPALTTNQAPFIVVCSNFRELFLAISSNSALHVLRYSAIAISLLPAVALLSSPFASASEAFSSLRYCSILKRCWRSVSGCASNCAPNCRHRFEDGLEDVSDVFTRILWLENVSPSLNFDTASLFVTSATWKSSALLTSYEILYQMLRMESYSSAAI